LSVSAAQLDSSLNFVQVQPLRGKFTVQVPVTSSSPGTGTISTSPLTILGGSSDASTQFNALAIGVTNVTAGTPSGFKTPATAGSLEIDVNQSGLLLADDTVGNNLETPETVTFNGIAPGGLTILITSNDPSKLLLSKSPTAAGSASITLTMPTAGSHSPIFYAQGVSDTGTATYTAAANGFTSGTGTITLTRSGIVLAGPSPRSRPPPRRETAI
jgi:hypothetical protein